MPLTLPKNDAVIAVDENANCISRNDVSGYDKDKYLPDELLDENNKGYAYKDSEGNYYESLFGLKFTKDEDPVIDIISKGSSGGCNMGLSVAGLIIMMGLLANLKKR